MRLNCLDNLIRRMYAAVAVQKTRSVGFFAKDKRLNNKIKLSKLKSTYPPYQFLSFEWWLIPSRENYAWKRKWRRRWSGRRHNEYDDGLVIANEEELNCLIILVVLLMAILNGITLRNFLDLNASCLVARWWMTVVWWIVLNLYRM